MKDTVLSWLLEDENPAIKYRTMTELCDKNPEDCLAVYHSIWEDGQIKKMLGKQNNDGLWSSKDWGVHTSMRYLTAFAEHGLHKDERLHAFIDYTVDSLQFYEKNGDLSGCASPLTLRALVMLGYHERDDVKELFKKFAATQLFDGGFMCKMKLEKNPGRKSCYKAAFAGLLLYAACKSKHILPDNADRLMEYFIKRNVLYYQELSLKDGRFGCRYVDNFFPVEPMRIGLPLIVSAFSILGAGEHPALAETWELLAGKQNKDGKFELDGTLTKQPCSFGKVGQENKWMTFYAMLAEKHRGY